LNKLFILKKQYRLPGVSKHKADFNSGEIEQGEAVAKEWQEKHQDLVQVDDHVEDTK